MALWLMKSEPEAYGWADLVRDGATEWNGVRNNAATLNLKAMQVGDRAFFYHSVSDKAVVGIMEISRAAKPDGKPGERWVSVEVKPVQPLARPVTLAEIKAEPRLQRHAAHPPVAPVGGAGDRRRMASLARHEPPSVATPTRQRRRSSA